MEPGHPRLSIGRQCALLSLSRSSFYYRPAGETELNLDLMRQIDEQFLETPCLRGAADDPPSLQRGPCREREAGPAADAAHWPDADLAEAQHQQAREGTQAIPLPAGGAACGPAQPGLVRRHRPRCAWAPMSNAKKALTKLRKYSPASLNTAFCQRRAPFCSTRAIPFHVSGRRWASSILMSGRPVIPAV